MLHNKLTLQEKLHWYNYSCAMVSLYDSINEQLNHEFAFVEKSKTRIDLLKEVNSWEKVFYENMKADLFESLDKDDFLSNTEAIGANNMQLYSFKSLIRDWSSSKNYDQRELIVYFLKSKLQDLNISNQNKALFLGCGTGRYAVDLANNYEHIEAFDISLPMIWSIYYLMKVKKWDILLKTQRNCRKVSDIIQREQLEITDEQIEIIQSKINFFVADVKNLPLEDSSINHIYSIYFTDVLPLKMLFVEVNRLLDNNGLFIHFGPLDYFFTNENEMLTAEEVKLFFIKKGYDILADEFLETRHLYMENSMRHKVYDNWFFIAQKKIKKRLEINLNSCLILNNEIKLWNNSIIKNGVFEKELFEVSFNNKSFELPEIIFSILQNLNANSVLRKVLDLVDLNQDDITQVIAILQELYESDIIEIKN